MFFKDYDACAYYDHTLLSNKQTAGIAFYQHDTDKAISWYVTFAIADKRKRVLDYLSERGCGKIELKQTGRCGVEGLVWAKSKILEFANFISTNNNKKNKIIVQGSDNRRFRIYERYLSRNGFVKQLIPDYGWCMVRELGVQ